jgi:hypothetical protein
MRTANRLAAALLALALPCAAAVPPAPQSISASYDMYRNGGHIAVMSEQFEAKDGGYRIVSETQAIGLFRLFERVPLRFVSTGKLSTEGLQPAQFEGKRGDSDPRQVRGEFDWQTARLTLARDGKTDTLPLPPGTQDRLSVMYQFMFLAPDKRQRVEFSMTNGRKLDQYRYTVRPGVEIDTALGRIATLHLVKQHLPDETAVELWLAPQHRYLPVRMLVVEEDGTRYEQHITRLEVTP